MDPLFSAQSKYYVIKLEELLEVNWSDWFDGFLVEETEGGTVLKGHVRDQSDLHGLLAKIRNMSLTLISIEEIKDGK